MDKKKSITYQSMAKRVQEKLGGRPYAMGLDLGVGSIGVAIIAQERDDQGRLFPTEVVFASSRLFQPSAGAKDRTEKRGQRNAIRHKANRMEKLWKILGEKGLMLPFSRNKNVDPARIRFADAELRKNPYILRFIGISKKLSLPELGVALYHIAGHRGASSIRSFSDAGTEDKKESEKMRQTERISKEQHLGTFIEVLYKSKELNKTNFRNSKYSPVIAPLPTRDIIMKELDRLLECQKAYYPEVLNDEYIKRVKDAILYENEKIVPEAGSCPYFKSEKRLPKAAFINEERRLWEAVNNIRIIKRILDGNRVKTTRIRLTDGEREKAFIMLRTGAEISVASFKRMFPQYQDCVEIKLQGTTKKTQKIEGFRFKDLEDAQWFKNMTEDKQLSFIEAYVNCPDDEHFKALLRNDFNFCDDEISEALSISLPSGYAPVGLTAMKIILEYIRREGLSYPEAELKAIEEGRLSSGNEKNCYGFLPYYGKVIPASTQALAGKAWYRAFEEKRSTKGFIKPFTNREEEKYGKIANPVVHQSLNELRKLVNEVLEVIGYKPENICIELSRELKVGQEKRDLISRENSKREKDNKRIFDQFCKPHNLSKKYIKTFKLLEEQKGICPYCLKAISVSDVVNSSVDIDHIYPDEDTGDSSFSNLVLAHKGCNELKKGKKIPYEAFSHDPIWSKIEQNANTVFPPSKANRFSITAKEYEEYLERLKFAPRFSSDNAYIARVACEYLRSLYASEDRLRAVRTIKSSETAVLRRAWNLNRITALLADKLGAKDPTTYECTKDRTDHRHHALDAIVIAYYTPFFSQIIADAIAEGHSMKEIIERMPIPKYYRIEKDLLRHEQADYFSNEILNFILYSTFVSRKQSINKNGTLVDDTVKSVLAVAEDDVIICSRKTVSGICATTQTGKKGATLERILKAEFKWPASMTEDQRAGVSVFFEKNQAKYADIISHLPEAEEALRNEWDGSEQINITEKSIIERACKLTGGFYYQIENRKKYKMFFKPGSPIAFDTGENYSLDLYLDMDGTLCGEIIRKINVIDSAFTPHYKLLGYSIFERIYPKDILEIDCIANDQSGKKSLSQSFVTPNAALGKTFIVIDSFTEIGSSIQVHYSPLVTSSDNAKSSFYVSGIGKLNARKVVLSSLGLVIYRSRILKGIK